MAITVGQVYRLTCHTCATVKPKLFVVAYTWPELQCFLINSARSPYSSSMAAVAQTQIPVTQSDHTFLTHDSWLDCSNLKREYAVAQLEALVAADASLLRGELSAACKAAAKATFAANRLLPREQRSALLAIW
jgi:hypothetical protein